MLHWAEMREQIRKSEWIIQAIFAKHSGDYLPGWGEWPALISAVHADCGKIWEEGVMVPIPFDPGWKSVFPPK